MTVDGLVEQLVDVGRRVVALGLVVGSGGNLSARLPGGGGYLVTGSGTWLDRLRPEDFTTLEVGGRVVAGARPPSSEWKLHDRVYQARPDANAVVHAHPQHAVMLDALGREIRLLTLDQATYVGSIGRTPYHASGSDQLAAAAAEQAQRHDVVMLGFHGCCALGEDVATAFRRAANLEDAAAATYRCLTLGDADTRFPDR